jgi:hypothetical protein
MASCAVELMRTQKSNLSKLGGVSQGRCCSDRMGFDVLEVLIITVLKADVNFVAGCWPWSGSYHD